MKLVWLEQWQGISIAGHQQGGWHRIGGARDAEDDEISVSLAKSDILLENNVNLEQVDGVRVRWQVQDAEKIPA